MVSRKVADIEFKCQLFILSIILEWFADMFMAYWFFPASKPCLKKSSCLGFRSLLLLLLLVQADTAFSISTMRCGSNIIELGDDKYKVVEICGEPESISYRSAIVGNILHHPRRTLDIERYEEVQVEEWIYNFGRNRIKELLRFENGILVEIRDLKRAR